MIILINQNLKKMKKNSIYINIGRGTTTNEDDLYEILKNKLIQGAVLDVTKIEPLNKDSPLYLLDNILISNHSCDLTEDYDLLSINVFVQFFEEYVQKKQFSSQVNKELGY